MVGHGYVITRIIKWLELSLTSPCSILASLYRGGVLLRITTGSPPPASKLLIAHCWLVVGFCILSHYIGKFMFKLTDIFYKVACLGWLCRQRFLHVLYNSGHSLTIGENLQLYMYSLCRFVSVLFIICIA